MKTNQYNDVLLDESDILAGIYSLKINSFDHLNVLDQNLIDQFNHSIDLNADHISKLHLYKEPTAPVEVVDQEKQLNWLIPESYKTFDIDSWLYEQCKTEEQTDRVKLELSLFTQQGMHDVLVCLKYLVDYMREHEIVWGLGRGSSVASYCLYLIGIHKIDSLAYNLDIKEFLKGELNDKTNL